MKFLLLICVLPSVFSITIRDASVVGDGGDENMPVEEGKINKIYFIKSSCVSNFYTFIKEI